MRRTNIIITLVLAVVALLAWLDIWVWMFLPVGTFARQPQSQLQQAIAFSAFACVGWSLIVYTQQRGDYETRCRKCKYILKGLSEPRCPECGEPI